jgi:CheY-like chemotaxis protein
VGAATLSSTRVSNGSETVLLAEDEEAVRRLAKTVLVNAGYTVFEAAIGSEAISIAENGKRIDLLLTDVVMPGTSGKELARNIQRLVPGIRVLYMSGYTDDAIVHHGVIDPGTPFLEKPFTPDSLLRKVREILD